ncbi:MAG: NUDIX domain-containing protein, partial [Bryobacterales bacterium]|nr:NUDIX domain-containing protein [Bryobacterales bacterium]
DLPHVVVDGNVLRVMSRYAAEPGDIAATSTRARLRDLAQSLMDPARAADFNQALMELGATLCLPRDPQCLLCPISSRCAAKARQRQHEFPIKARKQRNIAIEKTVLIVEQNGSLLLWKRPPDSTRMAGFWELPDASQLPGVDLGPSLGEVRHGITVNSYRINVCTAQVDTAPEGFAWVAKSSLADLPLSTITRKALARAQQQLTIQTHDPVLDWIQLG